MSLQPNLNEINGQINWNFDLDDCDNILRVVCLSDIKNDIIKTLQKHNFMCEELPD